MNIRRVLSPIAIVTLSLLLIPARDSGAADAAACTYPDAGAFSLQVNNAANLPASAYLTTISIMDPAAPSVKPGQATVLIDTGSTGIVVTSNNVPHELFNKSSVITQFFYSSSGNYMIGKTIQAVIGLPVSGDKAGASVNTKPIDILAAACACKLDTRNPPTNTASGQLDNCPSFNGTKAVDANHNYSLSQCGPAKIGMMGVGYDRGATPSTANNPFLNLPSVKHPGYLISASGIALGLTSGNSSGFSTIALTAAAVQTPGTVTNWTAPQACAEVYQSSDGKKPGTATAMCGSVLMDTGIDYMFLAFPKSAIPSGGSVPTPQAFDGAVRNVVPPKWTVDFYADNTQSQKVISFEQGAALPPKVGATQTVAVWTSPPTPTTGFINTGRRLLRYGSYMFDAQCGLLGFKQNAAAGK